MQPRWRRDGRELFYLSSASKLMAVPIRLGGGAFETGKPEELFEGPLSMGGNAVYRYGVAPDGQRFLILANPSGAKSDPITVVLNWMSEVRAN